MTIIDINTYNDNSNDNNNNNDLRELFYCRNPGDARVKIGSDREAVTSLPSPKWRCRRDPWFKIAVLREGTLQN